MSTTINGGPGGVIVINGGGGTPGTVTNTKPTQPDFHDIITGTELNLLWKIIADFLQNNPDAVHLDPSQLDKAIATYLDEHPEMVGLDEEAVNTLISTAIGKITPGHTDEQIKTLVDDVIKSQPQSLSDAFAAYLAEHPQGIDDEALAAALTKFIGTDEFKEAVNALITTGIESADLSEKIADYLSAHPDDFVSQAELTQALTQFLESANFATKVNSLIATAIEAANLDDKIAAYLEEHSIGSVSPEEIKTAVNDYLAANPPSGTYRKFDSWAALKAAKPAAAGERVYLNDYYGADGWAARVLNGGSWFVGNIVSSGWKADDKGIIASDSSDQTYFWKRDLALDDLTVMHFGAVGDGVTDDSGAAAAMFDSFRSAQTLAMNPESNMMPIKFPAGRFMIKPLDLTTRGTKTSDYDLNIARQKVIWRENGLQRGLLGGSGTGVGANGGNAASYSNVDVAWVKANKPSLYLEYSAQENHNGYNAIGYFGLTGAKVHYGRGIQTVIVSDNTPDTYVFEVRAIRTEMHGIQFEGGAGKSSEVKDYGTNGPKPGVTAKTNQGFFKNWRSEGQYYDVSCTRMLMVGGRSFDMVDTLDAKFDQCYSELCWDTVIYSGWSNAVTGAWDHGTALEICNSHFVTHLTVNPPIYAPRCAQSMIRNVWIEQCLTPAVLHDAAFTLDTFCVEACDNPVYALNARDVMTVYSAPTGVKYDTTTRPYLVQPSLNDDQSTWQVNPNWKAPIAMADRSVYSKYDHLYFRPKGSPIIEWLSAYERGHVLIDNKGIDLQGVITAGVLQSGTVANPYPEARWVCIGMLELRGKGGLTLEQIREKYAAAGKTQDEINAAIAAADYGPGVEIEVNNSRATGTYDELNAIQNRQAGKTVIRRKQSANFGPGDAHSYWHEGDVIVQDVGVSGWGNTKVWLKLPANSGELSFTIKGGGVSRKNGSGTCTRFEPGRNETCAIDATTGGFAKDSSGNVYSDLNNRLTDTSVLRRQWNVNVGNAGIGLSNLGTLVMKTIAPAAANLPATLDISGVGVWQTVSVDGVNYYMPLFKKKGT